MSGARYVFCQYCDDIRDEVGGKVSLMGMYQGGMTITGPVPHILPKLVISASIATPVSTPFEDLRIEVVHGEHSIQTIDIPADDLKNGFAAHKDGSTMFALQMIMVLQPLVVPTSGKLFVRVHTNGTTLDSNPLHIQVMNSPPLPASSQ